MIQRLQSGHSLCVENGTQLVGLLICLNPAYTLYSIQIFITGSILSRHSCEHTPALLEVITSLISSLLPKYGIRGIVGTLLLFPVIDKGYLHCNLGFI